jgi:CheY-like chemotaxis protein
MRRGRRLSEQTIREISVTRSQDQNRSATRLIREHEAAQADDGKSENPVYIIALTADAVQGDRDRCIQAGMNDYLSKPLRTPDLQDALERCWEERRTKRPAPEDTPKDSN